MKGTKMNLSYGLEVIYEDADFHIDNHDKVGIVGVNGARLPDSRRADKPSGS